MTDKHFILEVKTEYPPIVKNFKKYEAFMNHWFEKKSNPYMAIETFSNGVLYFFESSKDFNDLVDKTIEELISLNPPPEFHKKNKVLNFFLHRVIKKKNFPEDGIEFCVNMVGSAKKLTEIREKYDHEFGNKISHIIYPTIQFRIDEKGQFHMKFLDYNAIIAFGNFMFYFVYKIESS